MNLNQPRALTGRVALICGAIMLAAGIALYYSGRQALVAFLRSASFT